MLSVASGRLLIQNFMPFSLLAHKLIVHTCIDCLYSNKY